MDGVTMAIPLRKVDTCRRSQANAGRQLQWFASIPPERTGLHGEYDYHGLSKRVSHYLKTHLSDELCGLKIRQRGRVILLSGRLESAHRLREIVELVQSVDGVDAVEAQNVKAF